MNEDSKMKTESLADGLKIAVTISSESQKRALQDVKHIEISE